jgi:hypothetical protein
MSRLLSCDNADAVKRRMVCVDGLNGSTFERRMDSSYVEDRGIQSFDHLPLCVVVAGVCLGRAGLGSLHRRRRLRSRTDQPASWRVGGQFQNQRLLRSFCSRRVLMAAMSVSMRAKRASLSGRVIVGLRCIHTPYSDTAVVKLMVKLWSFSWLTSNLVWRAMMWKSGILCLRTKMCGCCCGEGAASC